MEKFYKTTCQCCLAKNDGGGRFCPSCGRLLPLSHSSRVAPSSKRVAPSSNRVAPKAQPSSKRVAAGSKRRVRTR